ncbi:hypothetical protein SLNWT_1321 [Streptomyces albus]|uniref:Uncharacterized protein n=1 Tax=Streptomyces albus (strain ATCC 21838 / DSM 41398 / FERM P-419 / JCM 4703 / NBRC 107858) TaxID=1081613 RepID=A0A0B5EUA5_STRA4|nr:hypothetical protein SLNWT_1321 [Streptomyces albus]AOU76013.1 hypothetical protein SLNHY_1322 [Streptomyces albus]
MLITAWAWFALSAGTGFGAAVVVAFFFADGASSLLHAVAAPVSRAAQTSRGRARRAVWMGVLQGLGRDRISGCGRQLGGAR